MICACIKENKVVGVLEFQDESSYQEFTKYFDLMVDVSNYTAIPAIGWDYIQSQDKFNYGQLSSIPSVKITKLAFESRLTPLEEGGIIGFALNNFSNSNAQIKNAACQVFALLRRQANATYVDLNRADTVSGVSSLVTLGLLTSQRVTEILTTPPTYEEIYKG